MHLLSNARGSASEVETELVIARRLGYLSEKDYARLRATLNDLGKMITGLLNHLGNKAR